MADEGARFTQWYATSGLCTPSRGAMLTGRYAQRYVPPAGRLLMSPLERTAH